MTEDMDSEFTPEQLLQQAQLNATAFALTSMAYVREHHSAVDECVLFVGRRFAPGWEEFRGQPVKDVARMVALNVVSMGGTLQTLSGDNTRAELLIIGWPTDEMLSELGLTQRHSDSLYSIFQPIMDYLDIHYEWQRQNDRVLMVFTQVGRS